MGDKGTDLFRFYAQKFRRRKGLSSIEPGTAISSDGNLRVEPTVLETPPEATSIDANVSPLNLNDIVLPDFLKGRPIKGFKSNPNLGVSVADQKRYYTSAKRSVRGGLIRGITAKRARAAALNDEAMAEQLSQLDFETAAAKQKIKLRSILKQTKAAQGADFAELSAEIAVAKQQSNLQATNALTGNTQYRTFAAKNAAAKMYQQRLIDEETRAIYNAEHPDRPIGGDNFTPGTILKPIKAIVAILTAGLAAILKISDSLATYITGNHSAKTAARAVGLNVGEALAYRNFARHHKLLFGSEEAFQEGFASAYGKFGHGMALEASVNDLGVMAFLEQDDLMMSAIRGATSGEARGTQFAHYAKQLMNQAVYKFVNWTDKRGTPKKGNENDIAMLSHAMNAIGFGALFDSLAGLTGINEGLRENIFYGGGKYDIFSYIGAEGKQILKGRFKNEKFADDAALFRRADEFYGSIEYFKDMLYAASEGLMGFITALRRIVDPNSEDKALNMTITRNRAYGIQKQMSKSEARAYANFYTGLKEALNVTKENGGYVNLGTIVGLLNKETLSKLRSDLPSNLADDAKDRAVLKTIIASINRYAGETGLSLDSTIGDFDTVFTDSTIERLKKEGGLTQSTKAIRKMIEDILIPMLSSEDRSRPKLDTSGKSGAFNLNLNIKQNGELLYSESFQNIAMGQVYNINTTPIG